VSILDLQAMPGPVNRGAPGGSRTSKGCGNSAESTLSLLCNVLTGVG
jgi:hypothetical protein